jgi:hypothetical protein
MFKIHLFNEMNDDDGDATLSFDDNLDILSKN